MKGVLRNDIMDKCEDEDFADELKGWIDDIEQRLKAIRSKLDIDGLSDLRDIEDAYDELDDLCDELF